MTATPPLTLTAISIRPLTHTDYNKSFLELINTFTRHPAAISYEDFQRAVDTSQSRGGETYVIEQEDKIIGTVKVLLEPKFHNNLRMVGHIEDMVVSPEYRGQGLGHTLLDYAIRRCREANCYKIVLNTNPRNKDFYLKKGFIEKGTEMTIYC